LTYTIKPIISTSGIPVDQTVDHKDSHIMIMGSISMESITFDTSFCQMHTFKFNPHLKLC